RIDLGIGRAPGGSPLEAFALRRERTQSMPDDFPEQLVELLAFLRHDFPPHHAFGRIKVSPDMPGAPDVWLLGSSLWSASAAAQLGLPYAFAHFISPEPTRAAIEQYRAQFRPSRYLSEPHAIVALGAICAPTDAQAERLAASARLMRRRLYQGDLRPIPTVEDALRELSEPGAAAPAEAGEWPRYFAGAPANVREKLGALAAALALDELMIVTIVHDQAARLRSYELLAGAFGLTPQA
ncbi:MAG TPA: MsnO8 family LLM class oxidoreductase, partial [Steroidobacteraceae bacterium]